MENIKAFFKSLIVKIISGIITTLIVNFAVDKITKFNVLEFCCKKLFELIKLIWHFLNIKIAIWIYIIISILLVTLTILYLVIKNKKEEIQTPDFLKYREDKYKERVKFTWEYKEGYDGKYRMDNFIPICECGCQLDIGRKVGNTYYGVDQYICPKCERQYGNVLTSNEMESFEKILISNIHSGEYKKNIQSRKGE